MEDTEQRLPLELKIAIYFVKAIRNYMYLCMYRIRRNKHTVRLVISELPSKYLNKFYPN